MAVLGVGLDLTEVARIKKSLSGTTGKRFLDRLAHPMEKRGRSTKRDIEYWAARFAAKEAFAKALGTGIGKSLSLEDIGVVNKSSGAPKFVFSARLEKTLKNRKIDRAHVSITHTNTYAAAVVILEGK